MPNRPLASSIGSGARKPFRALLTAIALSLSPMVADAENAAPDEASLRAADAAQMRAGAAGDAKAYAAMTLPNFMVNAPNNRVATLEQVLALLESGEIASEEFERSIERVAITANVGIVMGSETVTPASGTISGQAFGQQVLRRRFTNIYVFDDGHWRYLARHANVAPETPKNR